MKPFSRKIEKILAWIANVIMILVTGLISLAAFSGQLEGVLQQPQLSFAISSLAMEQEVAMVLSTSGMSITTFLVLVVKIYAITAIVALVLALIASFVMKARIVSGILFLISAGIVALMTVGFLIPVYLLHFVVAIMLFVRKAPKQADFTDFTTTTEKPVVDKIEYL